MGNTIPIKYHGETLACIDPSQVMAVVPMVIEKPPYAVSFKEKVALFFNNCRMVGERIHSTKIIFKNGSAIQIAMPFIDFINTYP